MGDDEFKNTIQQTTKSIKEIQRMLDLLDSKRIDYKTLNIKAFVEKSMSYVKNDIKAMTPNEIIDALQFYGEHHTERAQLLAQILESFRLKELDIKSWKPKEFAVLIQEIATL